MSTKIDYTFLNANKIKNSRKDPLTNNDLSCQFMSKSFLSTLKIGKFYHFIDWMFYQTLAIFPT